jgi:hypothetical protein
LRFFEFSKIYVSAFAPQDALSLQFDPWQVLAGAPLRGVAHMVIVKRRGSQMMTTKQDLGAGILMDINSRLPWRKKRLSSMYREFYTTAAAKDLFLVFFFAPDFDAAAHVLKGWRLFERRWIYGYYPAPQVIYNRINYRFLEKRRYNQRFIQTVLRHPEYHLFNARYLDKDETFAILSRCPRVASFLPATSKFSVVQLEHCLERYPAVFVKPSASSRGQGIIKINRQEKEADRWQVCRSGSSLPWYTGAKSDVLRVVNALTDVSAAGQIQRSTALARPSAYILQEGINLCTYGGRVFDIRAQVQKNRHGQWEMTGFGVRLAAPGAFITHVPNGGAIKTLEEVLPLEQCRDVAEDVMYLCLTAAALLEEGLQIPLGLLSFDIGVDQSDHRVKLIEANAKPEVFDEPAIRLRHWELLTDYFIYVLQCLRRERV